MDKKKVSLRRCIGCGNMIDKKELIRVIKTKDNHISIDVTGKQNGRGAYMCNSSECLNKAIKSRGLERSFKISVPQDVYRELEKELNSTEIR
ncbi:MAG: YlxR family protein [Lachnospiraceae bacterium]|nr:YlxR family protein [Lachnospiraceae bacterium]